MSNRFSRQRGLLRQTIVEGLKVEIDHAPEEFHSAMNLLGENLGVNRAMSSKCKEFTVRWNSGEEISEEQNCISVGYGGNGVFLDGSDIGEPLDEVYKPAVATIAACLVWSEILRRSGAYLPIEIPKISVSVNVRVNENALYTNATQLQFSLEGHETHQNIRDTNDGTGHRRVLLRLSDDDPLVEQLLDTLEVRAINETFEKSFPRLEFNLPETSPSVQGHLTVVGVGGLGTWCLHTLVEGLNRLEASDVSFLIFDKDMEVEEHNLNRQVIYSNEDIGMTKISATQRWLAKRLTNSNVELAYELIDAMAEDEFKESDEGIDLDDIIMDQPPENIEDGYILTIQESIERLQNTDLILGCLDAMRPRVLADYIAAKNNIPYVNGGVANFSCEFSEFMTSTLIDKYGSQIAKNTTVSSCQEDGDVPIASMVLTNAFVGSLQALSAIQRLSGHQVSTLESVYWNAHSNQLHSVPSVQTLDRLPYIEKTREALWPNQSLSNLAELGEENLL